MRNAIFLLLVACGGAQKSGSAGNERVASAEVKPLAGQTAEGKVTFKQAGDGPVTIELDLSGLSPGTHGFHIHEKGDCGGEFAANAGKHFNPAGAPHPQHAGDFGNIQAAADGKAHQVVTAPGITVGEGATSVANRAVIIHEGTDDLASQPSGNAGHPIACGVITMK